MQLNDGKDVTKPFKKSNQKENDKFIDAFRYFENANIRNRDAFSELLDYTMQNKGD